MKTSLIKRLIGMSAAASLSCTAVITGSSLLMSTSAADVSAYSEEETVDVIVKLKGDTLLDAPAVEALGTDYISTPGAAAAAADLKASQKAVQDKIAALYPDIEVKASFCLVMNGFECIVPKSLISKVEQLPGVEYVYENKTIARPEMNISQIYSSAPAFYQETGCYGEGKVITIIDSEFDITHPMFSDLADDIEKSITRADVRKIASTIGFNVDISADKAYLNSKVPFCASYTGDPYTDVPNDSDEVYHGTHVAGIAAGNEYALTENVTCAGIAKDAQLILMSASGGGAAINLTQAAAAFEDALKLGTDVISLSFGLNMEAYQYYPLYDCFDAADKAGVPVLRAAGNEGSSSDGKTENVDDATVNCFDSNSVLAVASADSDKTYGQTLSYVICGETEFRCTNARNSETQESLYISDFLDGEYEYECFDLGYPEEFEGVDLTGKIAVINRGGMNFEDKYKNASAAGAAGVIIVNYPDDDLTRLAVSNDCAMCMISYEDAQELFSSEEKLISFSSETDDELGIGMSDFSCWGPTYALDLRPDITGMGGNILSAAYNGDCQYISGTSMATPYVAGCTAVLLEYLEKNGVKLETAEKASYLRKLMMNSAEIMTDGDLFVSPRQQGAGLVSLTNALNEKVLLTGAEGTAKVNLYDGIKDKFTFTVDAQNISNEDVKFESARLVLATRDYIESEDEKGEAAYYVGDYTELGCEADVSALAELKAGEKKSIKVVCKLDSAKIAELEKAYINGFFIEGYIVLDGAENCCTTSIPLLGFHGDWEAAPVMTDEKFAMATVVLGDKCIPRVRSFLNELVMLTDVMNQLPEDTEPTIDNVLDFADEIFTPEQADDFYSNDRNIRLSPNGDGMNDIISVLADFKRFCRYTVSLVDEKGETVKKFDEEISIKNDTRLCESNVVYEVGDDIPEGKYKLEIEYSFGYTDKSEKRTLDIVIDKTAPELTADISEKKGKKLLNVKASDAELDGVIVYGVSRKIDESKPNYIAHLPEITEYLALPTDPSFNYSLDNSGLGFMMSGLGDAESYTFSEIFFPDEDGNVSFSYDVTDADCCFVTAIDKAYNMTDYSYETAAEAIRTGVWASDEALYQFNEDGTVDIKMYSDDIPAVLSGRYTADKLEILLNGESLSEMKIEKITADTIKFADDEDMYLYFVTDEEDLSELEPLSTEEACAALAAYCIKNFGTAYILPEEVRHLDGTTFEFTVYNNYDPETDVKSGANKFYVDLLTGTAIDGSGGFVPVFDMSISDFGMFSRGMWIENTDNELSYYCFNSENGYGYIEMLSTGERVYFGLSIDDENKLHLYFDEDEVIAETYFYIDAEDTAGRLILIYEDGTTTELVYDNSVRPLRFEPFNYNELASRTIKDYKSKTEKDNVSTVNINVNEDNDAEIELKNANGETVETYTVDPVSGNGVDGEGNAVELPQTGKNSPLTAAEAACAVLLMLSGTFALAKSGVFRRKQADEE